MKYLIGLVGENAAGKDTFTTFFKAAALRLSSGQAAPLTVARVRFSDVLYDTLKLWGISPTRSNLQNLAIIMDQEFGKGSLTYATEDRIKSKSKSKKKDVIIVEGVRWKQDVTMIRSFKNSILVYVTANPKTRYDRMVARGKKKGESRKSYQEFLKEELALTELDIPEIGASSDFKIENNGTLERFRQKIEKVRLSLKI